MSNKKLEKLLSKINDCFGTPENYEYGIYTKDLLVKEVNRLKNEVMKTVKENPIYTVDEKPHFTYTGRSIEIKSNGKYRGTTIKVDGKQLNYVKRLLLDIHNPNEIITVEMEVCDL